MKKIEKFALPKMPDDMCRMVETEVNKQINKVGGNNDKQNRRYSLKKTAAIVLAAAMAVGTTAFAGMQLIYHIQSEKKDNYALSTSLTPSDGMEQYVGNNKLPNEIPEVKVLYQYIPQGMKSIVEEEGKIGYIDDFYTGGISSGIYLMDMESSSFTDKLDTNVSFSENIKIEGRDAVYMEKQRAENGGIWFEKKIYILYPESYRILEMFGGSNISKEEMLKVAEGTKLEYTGSYIKTETLVAFSSLNRQEGEEINSRLAVAAQEMNAVHNVGETFKISSILDRTGKEITCMEAKVKEVKIYDDFTPIKELKDMPDGWLNALDAKGKLIDNVIQYIKSGDGIYTTDEIMETKTIGQKLVYLTIEYKNTGIEDLEEVMFGMTLMRLIQNSEGYRVYDRASESNPTGCDRIVNSSVGSNVEMMYYDVQGGERHNNYIPKIESGETVTVHMAQIVNEDELDKLYLNLDTEGSGYVFTERTLETGLIDIRQ